MNEATAYDVKEEKLRCIRFFLHPLKEEDMIKEIESEKEDLAKRYNELIQEVQQEKESENNRSDIRQIDIRNRYNALMSGETATYKSRIDEKEKKRSRKQTFMMLWIFAAIGLMVAIFYLMNSSPMAAYIVIGVEVVVAVIILILILGIHSIGPEISSIKEALEEKENEIKGQMNDKIEEEKARLKMFLNELSAKAVNIEKEYKSALEVLQVRLGKLIQAYNDSIATDDEVKEFISKGIKELQRQVLPSLGMQSEDITDKRSAEIWAPTSFQIHEIFKSVSDEANAPSYEIRNVLADDIISPLRVGFAKEEQWTSFRNRILIRLGLSLPKEVTEEENKYTRRLFNTLTAIKFSQTHEEHLSGHYFYQTIICAGEYIGLFRGYINIFSGKIAYTYSLHIPYTDVTSIGVETTSSIQQYGVTDTTIDQHVHTLTLELSSGTSYRMSGDAGSSELKTDLSSKANNIFKGQITNIRRFIMEYKAQGVPDQL